MSFPKGSRVHHPVFGDGTVTDVSQDDEIIYVRFDAFGERRIAPDMLALST